MVRAFAYEVVTCRFSEVDDIVGSKKRLNEFGAQGYHVINFTLNETGTYGVWTLERQSQPGADFR